MTQSIGYNQSQSAMQSMLQGPAPREDNELVDICIPDVWTPDGKDAKPISIYCTVEVCRLHTTEFKVDDQGEPIPVLKDGKPVVMRDSGGRVVFQRDEDGKLLKDDKGKSVPAVMYEVEKGSRYGSVVNHWRNFRYHDGDDAKFVDPDMSEDDRNKARNEGRLSRAQTFNPMHCYPAFGEEGHDISKLSWPKDISPEMRAAWHRETFQSMAAIQLMGLQGRGKVLNAAFRVVPKVAPAAAPAPAASKK